MNNDIKLATSKIIIKGSHYKLGKIVDIIRKKSISYAIDQLTFMRTPKAQLVLKTLNAAVADAVHNFKMNRDVLFVDLASADKHRYLKRFNPRGRGRVSRIEKKYSILKIGIIETK